PVLHLSHAFPLKGGSQTARRRAANPETAGSIPARPSKLPQDAGEHCFGRYIIPLYSFAFHSGGAYFPTMAHDHVQTAGGHTHAKGHAHSHDHDHGAHDHHHGGGAEKENRIATPALLAGGFMGVELVGGIIAGSLALMADAGHMLSDFGSLALAWIGFRMARRPADARRTFGFRRFPVLAAFVNGLTLFLIVLWIGWEAVQ